VLEPITIHGLTIKNRVVRTAHGTNIGNGRVDEHLIAYHAARARGGVGLSILEAASVHHTDTGTLRLHDDRCVDDFRRLMSVIEPTGMRMFAQLNHLGHDGVPMHEGDQPWSASAVRSPGYGWPARAMTVDDIEELIVCFARVAGWAREGGLHGVEVHAAHGYLLQQFQSPVTNHRDDRYGGSFENRLRLTLDVVRAVRAAVGPDFVVGLRTGSDATDAGLQPDDCADVVRAVVDTGLIDYVNVTYGSCHRPHKIIGAMHERAGYELPYSEVVTKATTLPTLVTGRFRTLEEADAVIESGVADLVGMTRAHIADPEIVVKTISGRTNEVRPCIACNQGCVGGLGLGRMACAVNADVGFEHVREVDKAYEPVTAARNVLVVGGGPAGLEAARVAALRSHRVTLLEADDELGGNMRWSRLFPERALIGESIDWLIAEIGRLGVEVQTGQRVDDATIETVAPDTVIIATGSSPEARDGEWTSTSVAQLTAPPTGVGSVNVLDAMGSYEAVAVAEKLTQWGIDVAIFTTQSMLAAKALRELVVVPAMERIGRLPGRLSVTTKWDGADSSLPDADATVRIKRERPSWLPAHGSDRDVFVVGDAATPGNLWDAIRTGNEAGRRV
jgi:2,4-dienoyl-CoA reductase-like NADH-dependent reductase (Old Yellow Enzyme family)